MFAVDGFRSRRSQIWTKSTRDGVGSWVHILKNKLSHSGAMTAGAGASSPRESNLNNVVSLT